MKKEQTTPKKTLHLASRSTDKTFKIATTAILLLVGTWIVLKISKEMLKELEGMGL